MAAALLLLLLASPLALALAPPLAPFGLRIEHLGAAPSGTVAAAATEAGTDAAVVPPAPAAVLGPAHGRPGLPPGPPPPPPSPVLGVESAHPRLSWMLNSSRRGDDQLAYRLIVTHTSSSGGALLSWDSGRIASGNRTVAYGGRPLQPFGSYSWSVQWWSSRLGSAVASAPSELQHFTMAPVTSDWAAAEWVGGGNQLRAEFQLSPDDNVSAATLCVAGLGLAQPSLNGHSAADHSLGPQSQLFNRVLYTTYNVSALLLSGTTNALGLTLGSGKYSYLGLWCNAGSPQECLAARYLLHVQYALGDHQVFASQANQTAAREGPIRYDDYFQGEFYDARREQPGWNSAGFKRTWAPAWAMSPNVSSSSVMSSALIQPIRKAQAFGAVSAKVLNKPGAKGKGSRGGRTGTIIYDFGQNLAGYCVLRLPVCGKGTVIKIRYAEATLGGSDGAVLRNQFESCDASGLTGHGTLQSMCSLQEDTYVCSGRAGGEVYEPTATYHGYRYVTLTGYDVSDCSKGDCVSGRHKDLDGYVKALLTSYLVHTDVADISQLHFDSFDPSERHILNDIHHATLWSQKSNLHSVPTDCPTRERRGWMADGWVSSDGGMLTLDTPALMRKWIRDMYDEQSRYLEGTPEHGCVPSIVPSEQPGGGDENGWVLGDCNALPWSVGAIVVPYNLYRHHNDLRTVAEYYSRMQLFMRFAQSLADNTTGLVTQNGLGDCSSPNGVNEDGIQAQTASFAQLLAWRMMEEMADAIGKTDDAVVARDMVANITRAYNALYLVERNGTYMHQGGTDAVQVANSMALYADVPTAAATPAVVASLVKDIEKREYHLSTGTIGTRTLFEALSAHNQTEVAYQVAVQETYPSHGHFVRHANATTLFESWELGSNGGPSDASMNHIMLGGQQPWYFSTLAGLSQVKGVAGAGWGSVRVRPRVPRALAGVALRLATDHGEFAVQWTQGNATRNNTTHFALTVSIPVGARAELCVPTLDRPVDSVVIVELDGVNDTVGKTAWRDGKFLELEGCRGAAIGEDGGAVCFSCGSGAYILGVASTG